MSESNILVIDDDKVDRLMVHDLVEGRYRVFEAASGEEAQKILAKESISCVLLDYMIPGTDSMALLSQIASRHIAVIMLTGEGNESVAVSAMKQGASDYIIKRALTSERLTRTIENAIDNIDLKSRLAKNQGELVIANDNLLQKVKELERLNHDLENFIHIAAHDLREPLKTICIYCDLIEKKAAPDLVANLTEDFDIIRSSAHKLAQLIDDLRALTHVAHATVDSKAFDLNSTVEQILSDYQSAISAADVIVTRTNLPTITAVQSLIKELYRNLVGNALKYGPPQKMMLEFTVQERENEFILGIKNSGSAIPEHELERVFQPFYRLATSHDKDGTGMGLALCAKIVERHDGKIWIESSPQDGVHVRFSLRK